MEQQQESSKDGQKTDGFGHIVVFTIIIIALSILLKYFVFPD